MQTANQRPLEEVRADILTMEKETEILGETHEDTVSDGRL